MCDLTKEFKLCTCEADKLTREAIGWVLRRRNLSLPEQYLKGKPAMPFFSPQDKDLRGQITKLLNTKNCFDFEYEPQTDDFLKIKVADNKWLAFRYQVNEWQEDESTKFEGWRHQLENYLSGKIKSL